MNTIEISGLAKSYHGRRAVDGVDLAVESGCITGFIGPNGAGKTTTIKMMLGLATPEVGEIRLFGQRLRDNERAIKDRLGVVLDQGYLYEELTVKETRGLFAPAYSRWDNEVFDGLARRFGLPPGQKVRELSRGMKTKLSLALALSHHADLLIMDEPTSGLDPLVRRELMDIIREFMEQEDKSVFFSTHITNDLDKVADRIILLDRGRVLLDEGKDELLERHRLVQGRGSELTGAVRGLFLLLEERGFGFEGLTARPGEVRAALERAEYAKPTVEDIMMGYVLGGGQGDDRRAG